MYVKTRTAIILSILSGLLLGASINYPEQLWFLSLVSIVPFLYVLDRFIVSTRQTFLYGWLFGSIFLGSVLIWFWDTLPLDWLGIESVSISVLIVFVNWFSLTVALGLSFAFLFTLFKRYRRGSFFDVITLVVLWVVFEYLRMWIYALISLGEESLFAPHFSLGFVGYALAENQTLLQFAKFGGVYTLSAFAVLVNGISFWLISQQKFSIRKKVYIAGAFLIILLVSPFATTFVTNDDIQGGNSVRVAVIYTNLEGRSYIEEATNLFKEISTIIPRPDIVVFPEDVRFLSTLEKNEELSTLVYNIFEDKEVLIIDSSRSRNEMGVVRSRLHYYNTKADETVIDEKQFLMPYGEYTPYMHKFLLNMFGYGNITDRLDRNRGYTKGDSGRVVGLYDGVAVGALFCSEILSPSLYREYTKVHGADILVNLSSQAWFHSSRRLHNQTRAIAKVRAVENQRPFIQSGNDSPAFILDKTGEIIADSGWGESSVIYSEIEI